ncbi:MAG: TM0106 family RecB-like putative nuclease [Homoserinimonas sp.]|nr:TM0106 family RecB-like putative nuclease [Homoserinimonas sp.]
MYLLDSSAFAPALVTSASDLTLASDCEFALLRVLDYRLGWNTEPLPPDDAMLERAAELGGVHEKRMLEKFRAENPGGVVEFEQPPRRDAETLRDFAKRTREALEAKTPVVYQGVFFDESDPALPFVGYADFLVLQPDGRYRVVDTKLARHVKVTALMQLAAYYEQLEKLGIPVDETVELILGNDRSETALIQDVRPVFQLRRARMHEVIAEHRAEGTAAGTADGQSAGTPGGTAGKPITWGDDRYFACGHCKYCEGPAAEADDLVTVAGMRMVQRSKLLAAGITTLTELATAAEKPEDLKFTGSAWQKLHEQAALQLKARENPEAQPPFEVINPLPIVGLPQPSPGDMFFDFEGDPMYSETQYSEVQADGSQRWGLDYLFGWVDARGKFDKLWAHDQASEAEALLRFLEVVAEKRQRHPEMHIYHYAAYEKTHLLSIAARHGKGEAAVDDLLRAGVLVDLYPIVASALRIGVPSYSIKKLEPLYMGASEREGVANAADSVIQYVAYRAARDADQAQEAQQILDDIAQYNAYDCLSTLRLRDWMRSLLQNLPEVGREQVQPKPHLPDVAAFVESQLDLDLQALAANAEGAGRPEGALAYRLAAAAIDYYRRERKSFWWEHYDRLEQPADEWLDTRGVLEIESLPTIGNWSAPGPRGGAPKRLLTIEGNWASGSTQPKPDDKVFLVYNEPVPYEPPGYRPGLRVATGAKIIGVDSDERIVVEEQLPKDESEWLDVPAYLTPGPPPRSTNLDAAIEAWGAKVRNAAPAWPSDAMSNLLLRKAPGDAGLLEPMSDPDDAVRAIYTSLIGMQQDYLAVQGPPGTGKTYVAAHVIKRLIEEQHWRVGVTAQSHKVIENVLDAAVTAGLDPALVAKHKVSDPAARFTVISDSAYPEFARLRAETGYVIGGTAWDMTNRKRVQEQQLDLLVIDEAGQFSLAHTIACAPSAKRILLLGDPQQLPQVSQGIHPAPVDGSALGYVIGNNAVLPERYGYFLPVSRRMDAAVASRVSDLSYEGKLHSHATTAGRKLQGVEPGLHSVAVEHSGNSTSSAEEASAVVELVRAHLGLPWVEDESEPARPLEQADVIVVTPYNAQVQLLRETLDLAGLAEVPVGTVDKFQGREAVISIVSLAASSAIAAPRGMDFLLNRNRLNVSISRAKWAAYLVYSPDLINYLPHTPEGLATLSRFVNLAVS